MEIQGYLPQMPPPPGKNGLYYGITKHHDFRQETGFIDPETWFLLARAVYHSNWNWPIQSGWCHMVQRKSWKTLSTDQKFTSPVVFEVALVDRLDWTWINGWNHEIYKEFPGNQPTKSKKWLKNVFQSIHAGTKLST